MNNIQLLYNISFLGVMKQYEQHTAILSFLGVMKQY